METLTKSLNDNLPTLMSLQERKTQARDNLFNAEHRDIMIRKYGATSAEWITVEDLMHDGGW